MKKHLSLAVLIMTLLTAMFSLSVSAAETTFTDIEQNQYRDAIIALSKLGVINGYDEGDGTNTFRPDATITRAEFTKMIVSLMGFDDVPYYSAAPFNDTDMWAKNYINTAYSLSIIDGMGDGTFAPDESVTYMQAQKMMVCALGYISSAEEKGGWPDGFAKMATTLNLTVDIKGINADSPAPRGAIAKLMHNALEVEMLESKNGLWESTNKTLLKDYLKVDKLKGTLVGAGDLISAECKTKLNSKQMSVMELNSNKEVIIDFSSFTQNVTDISKYLGNIITVYYQSDNLSGENTLVALDGETTKNEEISLNHDNIVEFSSSSLTYTDGAKQKTVKINTDKASVRYNGQPLTDDTVTINGNSYSIDNALAEWLSPESENFIYGDIKLTDSGSDGTINLIQIYNYETMVAYQAPKTTDYKITDKLITGRSCILDPNAASYSFTITKNGKQIETTAISTGDVVLIAESLDKSLYTVKVNSNPIKGSVSAMEKDTITVNKEKHKVGDMCADYISKNQAGKVIKLGVTGTFYTDDYGTIVYATIDTSAENLPYAYIANAAIEESEDTAYVTVYTDGTSTKTYKMKDKIKLNGSSVSYKTALERLSASAKNNNADADEDNAKAIYGSSQPVITNYSQPVRLSVSNNVISSIVTIDDEKSGETNESTSSVVKYSDLNQYTFTPSSSSSSTSKRGSFKADDSATSSSVFSTDDSTKIIFVPRDRTDRSAYATKGFEANTRYYVEAYDVKASKTAGLVLVYSNKDSTLTEVSRNTNFGIIAAETDQSYNSEDDETTEEVSVYFGPNNNSPTTIKKWQTTSDVKYADAEVGDVIQFAYNSKNQIASRINNIPFSDIASVLDGSSQNDGKLYDWNEEQEPDENNNYQSYKFDYRFKELDGAGQPKWDDSANQYKDEIYTNTAKYIQSRACMYNVSQVFDTDNKIYVTKNGFDSDGNYDDTDFEEIEITSSTKFLRMDTSKKEMSQYAEDTSETLTIMDLKSAQYYGKDCSKILICSQKGAAKLIVIYD